MGSNSVNGPSLTPPSSAPPSTPFQPLTENEISRLNKNELRELVDVLQFLVLVAGIDGKTVGDAIARSLKRVRSFA